VIHARAHVHEAVGAGDYAQGAVPAEDRGGGVRGVGAVFGGGGGVAVGVIFVGSDGVAVGVGQEHGAAEVVGVVGFCGGGSFAIDFVFEAVGTPDVASVVAHQHSAEGGVGVDYIFVAAVLNAEAVGVVAIRLAISGYEAVVGVVGVIYKSVSLRLGAESHVAVVVGVTSFRTVHGSSANTYCPFADAVVGRGQKGSG